MLVVAYAPSVFTCTLEDYTNEIAIDRLMDLSIYIWSIIILYEHNMDDNFWWRKNVDCCSGPLLTLPH